MSDFLSSLVLIIIGALLTGLLVPYIAGQWQRQQKALDTKSEMIYDIIEFTTEMMLQPIIRGDQSTPDAIRSHDKRVKAKMPDWIQKQAFNKARLVLNFPKGSIGAGWDSLYKATYSLVIYETLETDDRKRQLERIQEYLGEVGTNVNWGLLAKDGDELPTDALREQRQEASHQLRRAFNTKRDELINLMLRTHTYGEFSIKAWFKESFDL